MQAARTSTSATREYYGFVLYMASFVAVVLYCVWAVFPDEALEHIGITYYPSRHWALVCPLWTLGLIPFTLLMFTGANLVKTPPLDELCTLADQHATVLALHDTQAITRIVDRRRVPELQDVPVWLVNRCWLHDDDLQSNLQSDLQLDTHTKH
eukprot:jgi/Hompol1/3851/HPOL_006784-RA